MAGWSKFLRSSAASALLCTLPYATACDDSTKDPLPEDAGVPEVDAAVDAAVPPEPSTCCANEACTKVTPGVCEKGELCALDSSGQNGTCSAECPEAQACGSLCCPWGASCEKGQCVLSDLSVEVDPSTWPYPTPTVVGEDSCLAQDHCVEKPGRYTLLETGVRVKNAGKSLFKLPGVSTRDDMDVSFCQGSYLMRDFIRATIKDAKGKIVRETDLPTLCSAEGDDYVCAVSDLPVGKKLDLPRGVCNQLDITGFGKGDYRVELEVNPKHVVAEKRYDNNVASYSFSHTGCDGFLCGGECCPPDVVCIDGKCAKPNLVVRKDVLKDSLYFTGRNVAGDMCTQEDRCTLALGDRRLLAFETRIENVGGGDFSIGDTTDNPLVVEGCNGEALIKNLVRYRLLDADNKVAVEGHERNICLQDWVQAGEPGPGGPHDAPSGDCGKLTANWGTVYGNSESCQWVDVTGLKAGKYKLEVAVNPDHIISEENTDDNVVRIDVEVPAAECADKEVCGDTIDQDCDNLSDDDDEDCGGPGPDPDPDPTGYTATTGNTSCGTAHAVGADLKLSTAVDAVSTSELCGGKGASAFYALTVAADEIVYVDALDSGAGTSVILHGETCSDTPVQCSDKACGRESGLLARTLTPGKYIIEARTHVANTKHTVRVHIVRTPAAGRTLVTAAGVVEGDTTTGSSEQAASCTSWDDETGEESSLPITGPRAIYALAHCAGDFSMSTCGTAAFPAAGAIYTSLDEATYDCSLSHDVCASDPNGFTVASYFYEPGLSFVVVGGQSEGAKGEYQLQMSF